MKHLIGVAYPSISSFPLALFMSTYFEYPVD